jgi:DNA-binding NarL/FixJ family response regulator
VISTRGQGWPKDGARKDAQAPPHNRARVIVKSGDGRLRALIAERLRGLEGVEVEQEAAGDGPVGSDGDNGRPPALTPRELEVLGLMADGLSNKEIAFRLGVTAHTAKFHVDSVLHKLLAANRAEAVVKGVRGGLITI